MTQEGQVNRLRFHELYDPEQYGVDGWCCHIAPGGYKGMGYTRHSTMTVYTTPTHRSCLLI